MRLTGCIPDEPDPRDRPLVGSRLLAMRPVVSTDDVDLSDHVDLVPEQIAESCGGHALASAVVVCGSVAGTPVGRPSALFSYAIARLRASPPPLQDVGCRLRNLLEGARDYGLVLDGRWPELRANVNVIPPLDAVQRGDEATLEAYYAASSPRPSEEVVAALRRGYPCIFGMPVDEAFAALRTEVYREPGGAMLGNHAQLVVGYSRTLHALRVLGSWGTDFGDEGFIWIDENLFDRATFDRWVVQSAPSAI